MSYNWVLERVKFSAQVQNTKMLNQHYDQKGATGTQFHSVAVSTSPALSPSPRQTLPSVLTEPTVTSSPSSAHLAQDTGLCHGRFSALMPTGLKMGGGLQLWWVGARHTFKSRDERRGHLEHSWAPGPRVTVSSATARGQMRRRRGARHPPPPPKREHSRA